MIVIQYTIHIQTTLSNLYFIFLENDNTYSKLKLYELIVKFILWSSVLFT